MSIRPPTATLLPLEEAARRLLSQGAFGLPAARDIIERLLAKIARLEARLGEGDHVGQ
jgi:hypothetical protein